MIIGGFARSMLKNMTPIRSPSVISSNRLLPKHATWKGVLDEILNYSDSLYPTRDFWDVNQLVETALRDISDLLMSQGYATGYLVGR